jgi:putative ABC transport system permease protein
MWWLARKILLHRKGRFAITVMGITVSAVLALNQASLYLGMMGNATGLIRHTDADIWVTSKNIQSLDFANLFPERRINQVNALPDVLSAKRLILTWGFLKLADGSREQVQIVGFDPESGVGAPWSMVEGSSADVRGGRYMILDRSSTPRLGSMTVGSIWELNEKQFKLVGLSNGIRTFTTAPFVFVSYEQAQALAGASGDGQTAFVVGKLREPRNADRVVETLRASLSDNDVYTGRDFILRTAWYWTIQTGIGMALFLTALLALIVGGAVVGQTVYASTIEHVREFGTLKAIGARNSDLYKVILGQAAISAVIGFATGSAIVVLLRSAMEQVGVSLYLGFELFVGLFFVLLATCFLAAHFSIVQVKRLDPLIVFKD